MCIQTNFGKLYIDKLICTRLFFCVVQCLFLLYYLFNSLPIIGRIKIIISCLLSNTVSVQSFCYSPYNNFVAWCRIPNFRYYGNNASFFLLLGSVILHWRWGCRGRNQKLRRLYDQTIYFNVSMSAAAAWINKWMDGLTATIETELTAVGTPFFCDSVKCTVIVTTKTRFDGSETCGGPPWLIGPVSPPPPRLAGPGRRSPALPSSRCPSIC